MARRCDMFKEKKGQAAMEFLMTYGWAILAAIIAIGVLAYFYFSPGDLGANAAVLNAPFYVEAWNADASGVNLGIKNNGQDSLTVSGVTVTIGTNICTTAAPPGVVASGATTDIAAVCATALTVGDNVKGDIVVKYTRGSSAVELTSTGSVSTKVVA
ncbi:MAG: hypothetical protein V1889_01030 [archaeon]